MSLRARPEAPFSSARAADAEGLSRQILPAVSAMAAFRLNGTQSRCISPRPSAHDCVRDSTWSLWEPFSWSKFLPRRFSNRRIVLNFCACARRLHALTRTVCSTFHTHACPDRKKRFAMGLQLTNTIGWSSGGTEAAAVPSSYASRLEESSKP